MTAEEDDFLDKYSEILKKTWQKSSLSEEDKKAIRSREKAFEQICIKVNFTHNLNLKILECQDFREALRKKHGF